MGLDGLAELVRFVRDGGILITEGSTTTILPDYGVLNSVRVEHPTQLYTKGSIMRGMIADHKSPILYGYTGNELPIYFGGDPILAAGAGGRGVGTGIVRSDSGPVAGVGEDITPNAHPVQLSPFVVEGDNQPDATAPEHAPSQADDAAALQQAMRQFGVTQDDSAPARVVLRFPDQPNNILLSGELAGGQALTGRALAIDAPLGKGHVVLFALRPFWRWQTQGTFSLGFNTLLNWDHLDAGSEPRTPGTPGRGRRGGASPGEAEDDSSNQQ